jgi:hypothetical protein
LVDLRRRAGFIMMTTRRECLVGISAMALAACKSSGPTRPPAQSAEGRPINKPSPGGGDASLHNYTPEAFGAVGDGVTNDSEAIAEMSDAINRKGGGAQIVLRATTYIVGQQLGLNQSTASPGYGFTPAPVLTLDGCARPIKILGNGARLRCADGLRFGTFDPATGQPTYHSLPYTEWGERSAPYEAMILIQNCTGDVYVEDLELDGNLSSLRMGGPYGDTGWQLPADGLRLVNNRGNETIVRVHSHHHARDGVLIIGIADRATPSVFQALNSEYNARQGCSLIAGKKYSFENCQFNHTGKAGLMSAPGAGFDLEAELAPIREISFSTCEFSNNAGVGMGADSGDIENVTFDSCRFVGTTNWSAWPNKPYIRFKDCAFVGTLVHAFSDPDPQRAAQFSNCSFLDDPALTPTKEVYSFAGACVNLAVSQNVLFDGCRFDLKFASVLPWSWYAIYNNCIMSQFSTELAHPKGTYTGKCQINGTVELDGAVIHGDVTVNGQLVPRTA